MNVNIQIPVNPRATGCLKLDVNMPIRYVHMYPRISRVPHFHLTCSHQWLKRIVAVVSARIKFLTRVATPLPNTDTQLTPSDSHGTGIRQASIGFHYLAIRTQFSHSFVPTQVIQSIRLVEIYVYVYTVIYFV